MKIHVECSQKGTDESIIRDSDGRPFYEVTVANRCSAISEVMTEQNAIDVFSEALSNCPWFVTVGVARRLGIMK